MLSDERISRKTELVILFLFHNHSNYVVSIADDLYEGTKMFTSHSKVYQQKDAYPKENRGYKGAENTPTRPSFIVCPLHNFPNNTTPLTCGRVLDLKVLIFHREAN